MVVARYLRGLFIDDGGMAGAIIAWLALDGLLSRLGDVSPTWRGPVLLTGLVFLLSWACLRLARRRM